MRYRLNISIILILMFFILLFEGCSSLSPNVKYNRNRTHPPGRGHYNKSVQDARSTDEQDRLLDKTIDLWIGTPYHFGGEHIGWGVDCSAYVQQVMKRVYDIDLPRNSASQFREGSYISKGQLQRSDLVFFDTQGSGVSHVGIYLGDGKFTHASTKKGVCIDSFNKYVKKYKFVGGRRVVQ